MKALDLGTGSGAFAARLELFGCKVIACYSDAAAYGGHSSFERLDLNQRTFAQDLGHGEFDVVSAIEVIEHLEAPIRFLVQVRSLLGPGGFAVLTTPNVDSLLVKAKFLLKGTLRMFDQHVPPAGTPRVGRACVLPCKRFHRRTAGLQALSTGDQPYTAREPGWRLPHSHARSEMTGQPGARGYSA